MTFRSQQQAGLSGLKVSAIDQDAGNNSIVDYFLVDEVDWFVVRRDTGEVVVNRSLISLEHNLWLQLVVEARDRGMFSKLPSTIIRKITLIALVAIFGFMWIAYCTFVVYFATKFISMSVPFLILINSVVKCPR